MLSGIFTTIYPFRANSESKEPAIAPDQTQLTEDKLDLPPEILESSPTLQRWQQEIPDLIEDIKHDPSFRTRIRLGYNQFPSSNNQGGLGVGIEDLFIGQSSLTFNASYETSFRDRQSVGANLNYYLLPLGGYINIAPVVGYRYIQTNDYHTQGVNVGAKIILPLSRSGAADVSFTGSFISPGSDDEVGIFNLSVGYAITNNIRLSTDLQQQNSRAQKDNRVGIYLEWMP
ncbi:MAG: hypothetical protein VKJ02_02230 [Snowella sp.]|nr:hypothetical protein [Snowella sp.]